MSVLSASDRMISVGDLMESSRRTGSPLQIVEPARLSGPVLSGQHGSAPLRRGMRLHFRDALDLHDLVIRGEQESGLTIQVFLRVAGAVGASLGGRLLLPEDGGGNWPMALMTAQTRPELFERWGQKGAHVRKVSVGVSRDWLADCGLNLRSGDFDVERFADAHLAQRTWSASPAMARLAQDILRVSSRTDALRMLYLESRVVELVAETLATLTDRASPARCSPAYLRRMKIVEDYLKASEQTVVSLEELARAGGMSVSTLQRLFHAVHDMSAVAFIRRRNLDRARAALLHQRVSVKEAAHIAGYSSPANFSTAFRHRYGQPPGEVRRAVVPGPISPASPRWT